ncbi:hypothetical protein BDN71DRAFT_1435876 [Pleurotus eryngii]|uniref:Uncharacterized protein n=1 Tax=Pleurotus eryngii TaxID=5323 RepID=A0A9P5ZLI1_PLEER|nr:hypothetical protein BDN71DRAFT_1435876 [Pleurotus eryngii]
MIDCMLLLHEAINQFLVKEDFTELCQYQLGTAEWDVLKAFQLVLQVSHTFQQHLSSEKTPTLCDTIPAFKDKHPELHHIMQQGINKLRLYCNHANDVPAYVLAMVSTCHRSINGRRIFFFMNQGIFDGQASFEFKPPLLTGGQIKISQNLLSGHEYPTYPRVFSTLQACLFIRQENYNITLKLDVTLFNGDASGDEVFTQARLGTQLHKQNQQS